MSIKYRESKNKTKQTNKQTNKQKTKPTQSQMFILCYYCFSLLTFHNLHNIKIT